MPLIRSVLRAVLGAVILVFAAQVGLAVPASAHDAAESTSPAKGSTVATPPEKISITFNNSPLTLGSKVLVTDAAGNSWAEGDAEIAANVVSQRLRAGAPAGAYTVAWRVVGSDSHAIEGSFGFTAAAGAEGPTTAPATAAAPAVPGLATPQPGITGTPTPPQSAAEPFPWSLVIFAGTAAGILLALALMAKRRRAGGEGARRVANGDAGGGDAGANADGADSGEGAGAGINGAGRAYGRER